jgi:drug/metabolite transporter (DMT)-like permease
MSILTLSRLLLLAAIWGASFPLTRHSVPAFGPAWLIEGRVLFGAIALGLWCLFQGRRLALGRDWRHFVVLGVVNSALPFLCFGYAAQTFSASLLSIFNASTPIFAGILGAFWLKRRVSPVGWLGMAVGVAGVALIGFEGLAVKNDNVWWALVACFLAPLSYSYASLYATRHSDTAHPLDNAHGSLWVGAALLMPLAILSPAPLRQPVWFDWVSVAALGLLCTSYAYVLFFKLLVDIGPVKALSVTFLIPLFGVFWGWLFLDEHVSMTMIAGGVLVLMGSALMHLKKSD